MYNAQIHILNGRWNQLFSKTNEGTKKKKNNSTTKTTRDTHRERDRNKSVHFYMNGWNRTYIQKNCIFFCLFHFKAANELKCNQMENLCFFRVFSPFFSSIQWARNWWNCVCVFFYRLTLRFRLTPKMPMTRTHTYPHYLGKIEINIDFHSILDQRWENVLDIHLRNDKNKKMKWWSVLTW